MPYEHTPTPSPAVSSPSHAPSVQPTAEVATKRRTGSRAFDALTGHAPAVLLARQRAAGNRAVAATMASLLSGAQAAASVQRQQQTVGAMCGPAPEPRAQAPQATMSPPEETNVCEEQFHVLTYQGKQYAIPESQWRGFLTGLKRTFRSEVLRPIESRMSSARNYYDSMKALNNDQWAVAWVLEAVRTGINLDEVAPLITQGEAAVAKLRTIADGDDLAATEAAARTAEQKADAAYRAIQEYRARQISAGESTVTALEVTQTVCFTIFAIAGGAVLAAPVAAGGLGMGVVSSGAIMGGGTALLSSASTVGAKAVYGEEVGWQDLKNVTIDTAVGAAGGAVGGAVAAKLTPHLAPALTRSLVANGFFKEVSEEVLLHAVQGVLAGSSGGVVQGAINDGVRVLQGKATFEQLLRNVVVNLIAGGLVGLVGARLTPSGSRGPGAPTEVSPQTRHVRANPRLVAEYESTANRRIPDVVRRVVANERPTANRARLEQLRLEFDRLRAQVGNGRMTDAQRTRANEILRDARRIARDDYSGLQQKVMKQLRADPEVKAIEERLVAAGDAQASSTGTLRIKVIKADGIEAFEPFNLEHRVRLSDNPWLAKGSNNLIITDAPQNQQYLEAIRQRGGVWPTDPVEDFVTRHQLNDEQINFAPGTR